MKKIFISYSHDSEAHCKFVLELSEKFRTDGLDSHIDEYINGSPEEGWQFWMENQIEQADFVLLICTPEYLRRYKGLHNINVDSGRGVAFEGVVISQTLYDDFHHNKKFIAVIPDEGGSREDIPLPLKRYTHYSLLTEYDKLYRVLTQQPENEPRKLGEIRKMNPDNEISKDICPYRGLLNFDTHHSDYFFGRDEFIHELKRKILDNHIVSLYGATGSGKSSVVLSGLIPKLIAESNWEYKLFYPGADPFYSLALTLIAIINPEYDEDQKTNKAYDLARELKESNALFETLSDAQRKYRDSNILIIVDRFEEIYAIDSTNINNGNQQQNSEILGFQFLECLYEGVRAVNEQSQQRLVLLTISTSSGHDKTSSFPRYADVIKKSQIKLDGMNENQLRTAIEKPALMMGVEFETDLVGRILRNAGEQPGVLPLLEFALMLLWDKRKKMRRGECWQEVITHNAYEEIGEIKGALINHATSCLESLGFEEKEIVRQIFIRLIDDHDETSEAENTIPKAASKEELGSDKWSIVELLAKERLLVIRSEAGRVIVDIAHKALIRHWPIAKEWLRDSRSQRYIYKRISAAAKEWLKNGKKSNDLLSDKRLDDAIDFDKKSFQDFPLPLEVKQFIKKGRDRRRMQHFYIVLGIVFSTIVSIWLFQEFQTGNTRIQEARESIKKEHLSSGERIHFPYTMLDSEKRIGQLLFAQGNYKEAVDAFKSSRIKNPNDPETLIYMNNAKAMLHDYLTLAISVPVGGNLDISKEILRGIAQAQNEVNNRGGINGKLLHVIIANDSNDPVTVKRIAQYFIEESEVLAVIGSNASDVSQSAADIYQSHLVMISSTSFALDFEKIKKPSIQDKNFIFLAINSYKTLMPDLIKHIKEEVESPIMIVCHDSQAYDQKWFRTAFKDGGIDVANDSDENKNGLTCDFSKPEIKPEKIIDKVIKEKLANSLFIAPHVNRVVAGAHLAESSQGKLNLFGSPTLNTVETLKLGKNVEGMVLSVHWHPEAFPNHIFYNEARKLWQEKDGVTWRTATTYDAAQVVIRSLEQISTDNKKALRIKLRDVIADNKFKVNGASGGIRFMKTGEREGSKSFLLKIQSCEKCNTGYDFYPIPISINRSDE